MIYLSGRARGPGFISKLLSEGIIQIYPVKSQTKRAMKLLSRFLVSGQLGATARRKSGLHPRGGSWLQPLARVWRRIR